MERKEKPHGGLARSHSPSQDPDVTWYALKRREVPLANCFQANEPNETLPLPDGAYEADPQVSSATRNSYVKDNDDAPEEMHVASGLLASGAS
ncbi:hypothetical protein HN011_003502, partial [Eciton burchellii]